MAIHQHHALRSRIPMSRLLLAGPAPLLASCADSRQRFLTPDGPVAALLLHHFLLITLIGVAPVIVGVPPLAWHYRYGSTKARYASNWDISRTLEHPMWLLSFAIVVLLAVYLWNDTHKLEPYRTIAANQPPLRVQVGELDWKWLFIYPEYHIATFDGVSFDCCSRHCLTRYPAPRQHVGNVGYTDT
jgi:cytochrome o ubiquinol oxidase subunit 2